MNRKRAGFEVRDVHISHYGRICPIETPEGTNIGLIASLSIYADIDEYGFLITPYRVVEDGKVNDEVVRCGPTRRGGRPRPGRRAIDEHGKLKGPQVLARFRRRLRHRPGGAGPVRRHLPKQTVGVSAGLIPFLEHDDANRALMGSNMQRQAVPLLLTDPPVVATGMEKAVAKNTGMVVRAERGRHGHLRRLDRAS